MKLTRAAEVLLPYCREMLAQHEAALGALAVAAGYLIAGIALFVVAAILGILATVTVFAASSLTSLPPAVDVVNDRATLAEVAHVFTPLMTYPGVPSWPAAGVAVPSSA